MMFPSRVSRRIPVLLLITSFAVVACDSAKGDGNTNGAVDAGDKLFVDANPALDETVPVRNGPYLQAPAVGTITVSWTTDQPTTSRVEFGPEGGTMSEVSGDVFLQQPTSDDPILAGMTPDLYQHEVTLDGLQAGTRYQYRILSAAAPKPTGFFVGPPDRGDDFTFILMGDTRTRAVEHEQVVSGMVAMIDRLGEAAFVLNSGDLVATGGLLADWDAYFTTEAPLLSRVPLLAVFGNHELILGRTVFQGFFKAPPTNTSSSDLFYSADIGDVHVATVAPYFLDYEPHLDWLEDDLMTSDAPYKIVSMHPPMFTYSNHPPHFDMRAALLPILRSTGVSLMVTGHNHVYERFFGDGIQFVVTGGGGAPLYGIDDNPNADNTGAVRVAADETLHFLHGTVSATGLTIQTIDVPAGDTIDCFVLDPQNPGLDRPCN